MFGKSTNMDEKDKQIAHLQEVIKRYKTTLGNLDGIARLDVSLTFPLSEANKKDYRKLYEYCDSVEDFERNFGLEMSCGDGLYYSDFYKWSETGEALRAVVTNEVLDKYDGEVCTQTPPRNKTTLIPFEAGVSYRFSIKYFPRQEEDVFYLNGVEVGRKLVR
jgi:hypothetical protein